MKPSSHVHKFKRDTYSTGKKFYYCINGNCTFKIDVKHSLGKWNICHGCGTSFQMNEYSIRAANPKCMDCIKRRTISKDEPDANLMVTPKSRRAIDKIAEVVKDEKSLADIQERLASLKVIEFNPDDDKDTL